MRSGISSRYQTLLFSDHPAATTTTSAAMANGGIIIIITIVVIVVCHERQSTTTTKTRRIVDRFWRSAAAAPCPRYAVGAVVLGRRSRRRCHCRRQRSRPIPLQNVPVERLPLPPVRFEPAGSRKRMVDESAIPASEWSFAPRYAICDMPMAFLLVSSVSGRHRMRMRQAPPPPPPRSCGTVSRPRLLTPPTSSGRVEDRSRSAGAGIQLHGR